MEFYTNVNRPPKRKGEKISKKSKVIPGQGYTVRQTIEKAMNGSLQDAERNVMYSEDHPYLESIKPGKTDITDLGNAREKVAIAQKKLKSSVKEGKAAYKASQEAAEAAKLAAEKTLPANKENDDE